MKISTEYIIAYLKEELSLSEKTEFEKQLSQSSELRKETNDLRRILQMSADLQLQRQINVEKNWNELSRKIKYNNLYARSIQYMRKVAAILIIPLIALAGALFFQLNNINNEEPEIIEIHSAPGTISKLNLPDGSDVWLNAGSIIKYPRYFKGGIRQVTLEGEAYFKVSSDKSNRFDVVLSDDLIVSAYGTEFNINAYTDTPIIETTLVNGKVAVYKQNSSETEVLQPTQQAVYNKISGSFETKTANLSVSTGWKDGKMVFRRASMTEITGRLARKFNVDVILEGDELYDYQYSATFTDETLSEILDLLEQSAPITCKIIEPKQSDDYSYSKKTVIITVKKK